MRLTVTQFMTLDGVVQGPGAVEEDPSDGFDLGGWLPPHFDEAVGAYMAEIFEVADEFLLGRRTYDLMAAYWPEQTNPDGSVFELNALPKHVATTRPDELAWEGSVRIEGDVAAAVAELKRRPGRELQVHGSGTLVRSLMAADLVDAYHLLVFPVALGRGRRLFGDGAPPVGLRLTDSRMSGSGVAMLTYEAAGQPVFGSVLDETPGG
jgi:dihydrofolate reductase